MTDKKIFKAYFTTTHRAESDDYATNALEFDTVEDAVKHADDLFMRWFAAVDWEIRDQHGKVHTTATRH